VKLAQQIHYRFTVRRIKVSRGLICKHDQRVSGNRARDGDSLLLSS
jgi:hypothetical protein